LGLFSFLKLKARDSLKKKLPYDDEIVNLLNNNKYNEAIDLIIKFMEDKTISEHDGSERIKLSVRVFAVTIYEKALKHHSNKQYKEAIEAFEILSTLICKHPRAFDLDEDILARLSSELIKEAEGRSPMTMDEFNLFEDRFRKRAEELFRDKKKVDNFMMLFTALTFPAISKGVKEKVDSN